MEKELEKKKRETWGEYFILCYITSQKVKKKEKKLLLFS